MNMIRFILIACLVPAGFERAFALNNIGRAKIIHQYATSTLASSEARYSVRRLFDGDVRTGWAEGLYGAGLGTRIIVEFDRSVSIRTLYIANGVGRERFYQFNNRVRDLDVNGMLVTLSDSGPGKYQTVRLPRRIRGRRIVFTIRSVYRGSRWEDTSLSEIAFRPGGLPLPEEIQTSGHDAFLVGAWRFGRAGIRVSCSLYADHAYLVKVRNGSRVMQESGIWRRTGKTVHFLRLRSSRAAGSVPGALLSTCGIHPDGERAFYVDIKTLTGNRVVFRPGTGSERGGS